MSTFSDPNYVITSDFLSSIKNNYDDFTFQGFDAKIIREIIDAKTRDSEGIMLFQTICMVYALRGSKQSKILVQGKMKDEGYNKVTRAIKYFEIVDTRNDNNLNGTTSIGPKVVTINRIVCAYAHVIAQVIIGLGAHFRSVVDPDDSEIRELPLYYQFPQAPSIIPLGDTKNHALWKVWSQKFSDIIWSQLNDETVKKLKERQGSFQQATKTSQLYREEDRMVIQRNLFKLGNGNPIIFRSMRSFDESIQRSMQSSSSSSSSGGSIIEITQNNVGDIYKSIPKEDRAEFKRLWAIASKQGALDIQDWLTGKTGKRYLVDHSIMGVM